MYPEIEIRYYGNQPAPSCEVETEVKSRSYAWGHFRAEFSGYGTDDYDAKMNMMKQVDYLIAELEYLKRTIVIKKK